MLSELKRTLEASEVLLIAADRRPWLLSLVVHVALLVLISILSFAVPRQFVLTLTAPEKIEVIPEEFHFSEDVAENMGAMSEDGLGIAAHAAPEISDLAELVPEVDPVEMGELQYIDDTALVATPLDASRKITRGVAGVGVTGANGAIDRITHEILLSLEDRDTLIVWLFDQSGSLERQRTEINERLTRIYDELGLIHQDLQGKDIRQQPLLTSVMAFGRKPSWVLKKPTADPNSIQDAVRSISLDDSGIENVFTAVLAAADEFASWRSRRNIMLVAVTDEVGDDYSSLLEKCVRKCRKNAMPVYVLGVPAAFGRSETLLKWVDPNPDYDQSPKWGRVSQGPETLRPELLHLPFANTPDFAIDSGFGPFALTRLCYQTGGIYFAIHPNRRVGKRVSRREIDAFSAHFGYFFDPQRMRPYRPEYVSVDEYDRRALAHPARAAVLRAARMTLQRINSPRLRFVKRDEAQFATELTEAQKAAAKLEPQLGAVYNILKQGEDERPNEQVLRWQAAYDLAHGQTLAVMVRTRAYNEMLAKAKRGLKPTNEKNNTWQLVADNTISTSSRLAKEAEKAEMYLQRVVDDHAGTPWSLLAQKELAVPMGWRWEDSFTPMPGSNQRPGANNDNNEVRIPRDDQRRMLPKPPPSRDVPRL